MSRKTQREKSRSHRMVNALGKVRRGMTHEPIVHARAEIVSALFLSRRAKQRAAIANHSGARSPFTGQEPAEATWLWDCRGRMPTEKLYCRLAGRAASVPSRNFSPARARRCSRACSHEASLFQDHKIGRRSDCSLSLSSWLSSMKPWTLCQECELAQKHSDQTNG